MKQAGPGNPDTLAQVLIFSVVNGNNLVLIDNECIMQVNSLLFAD